MKREKIKEIALDICCHKHSKGKCDCGLKQNGCFETPPNCGECYAETIAKRIYDKGYRKIKSEENEDSKKPITHLGYFLYREEDDEMFSFHKLSK